jgi:hypothetical protein
MLSLPALEQGAMDALGEDETAARRLQEVEFATSSLELSRLVQAGDMRAARALVRELHRRFGEHPWLVAKLERLQELAARDPRMMGMEARYSAGKLSSRHVATHETLFAMDETESPMPAYLRKKSEEGKGRKGP